MQIWKRSVFYCTLILALLMSGVVVMVGGNTHKAYAASAFPSQYFAPYAEVGTGVSLQSVTQSTGQKYYTLAFIIAPVSNNACQADWGGATPINNTGSDLPTLNSDIQYVRSQDGDVIISFGGAAGEDLAQACGSSSSLQAQYQAVVNQYHATRLDFDVEGGQEGDSTTYIRRNTALAALQHANPGLALSFTLPADPAGLGSGSIGLLKDATSKGVTFSIVNLMVMDYGNADSQMGQEAINAANSLYNQLQSIYPSKTSSQLWSMVGLTPEIGKNDSPNETFSLSNASQVFSFAQANHIGELAFWAVSRDNGGCPNWSWPDGNNSSAPDTCSGISQSTYAFTNAWKPFTSGGSTDGGGGGLSGYYDIANRYSGLVLDDTNWSTSNGTLIQQWSKVSGQANQKWGFNATGDGYYYIVNYYSNLVLDDTNWSTSNGTNIQQWSEVSGQVDQEWSVNPTGDGYYYIVNRHSGLVLDDTNWSTSNGTLIQQWSESSGQTDQEWNLQQA